MITLINILIIRRFKPLIAFFVLALLFLLDLVLATQVSIFS